MAVENAGSNLGPKLPKHVIGGVAQQGETVFGADSAKGAASAWVIAHGNDLRQSPAQQLGSVDTRMPRIIGGDQDAGKRVRQTAYTAAAFGVVAFVLMKKGGKGIEHQVIAIGPVHETAPVILAEAGRSVAQLRVGVRSFSNGGSESYKSKRRIVEGVPCGDEESLTRCGGSRLRAGADGDEIGHHAENAIGLRW